MRGKNENNSQILKADKCHKQYKIQKNNGLFFLTNTPYNTSSPQSGYRFYNRSHEGEKEMEQYS